MVQRSLGGYEERKAAQGLLQGLYLALDTLVGPPECGSCCERATPVVSYTEAEHIRDGIHLLPPEVKDQVTGRCRQWLLQPTGPATRGAFLALSQDPLATAREVRWLRNQRCPFLKQDGGCLLQTLQPIECRVRAIPPEDRGPVYRVVERIMALAPQRTGFLPTQLMALLRIEEYTQYVTGRLVPDAKTATGGGAALVA